MSATGVAPLARGTAPLGCQNCGNRRTPCPVLAGYPVHVLYPALAVVRGQASHTIMGGDGDDESRQTISAAQLLSMGSCSAEEIGHIRLIVAWGNAFPAGTNGLSAMLEKGVELAAALRAAPRYGLRAADAVCRAGHPDAKCRG